jgi:5-formyltetrahydrofolate cyclo-ligase
MFSKAPHDTYTKPSSTQSEAPLSPEILAKFAKSKPSKHQPPPKQPPTNEQLLTNCWKHMPASQAAYMPVQPHQTLEECLQIEHQRRGAIYIPAPKPPQDPAFLPGNPIPFQLPPNTPVT